MYVRNPALTRCRVPSNSVYPRVAVQSVKISKFRIWHQYKYYSPLVLCPHTKSGELWTEYHTERYSWPQTQSEAFCDEMQANPSTDLGFRVCGKSCCGSFTELSDNGDSVEFGWRKCELSQGSHFRAVFFGTSEGFAIAKSVGQPI